MFDGPQGGAVSQAPVDDCVDGKEVRHSGRVQFPILEEREGDQGGERGA